MSTKHTPGPWKAHPTGLARSGLPEYQIHWSDIGECVAEVVHGDADARLIAATPELLQELKNLYKAYVNLLCNARDRIVFLGGDCDPVDVMEANDPSLRDTRAIIAKATGTA